MLSVMTIEKDEAFLRQISKEVDLNDPELENNIKDIKEWCLNNEGLYAMAAIQFGIPKRIVYIKSTKPNDTTADDQDKQVMMLNPRVISKQGKTEFWEACVSGLDNFSLVERPYKILIEYYDTNGEKHIQNFEGFKKFVHLAFSMRRKTLVNNLKSEFEKDDIVSALIKLGYNESVRPEQINVENFINLFKNLEKN